MTIAHSKRRNRPFVSDHWRCRYNKETCDPFKEPKLSFIIRISTLRWAGHVIRMEENCIPRSLMYMQPEGSRKWEDYALGGEMM
jgi:hypothetical protein